MGKERKSKRSLLVQPLRVLESRYNNQVKTMRPSNNRTLKTSDRWCAPAKDDICGAAYVASSKERRRGSDDHFRMVIPLDAISPLSPPLTKPLRRPSRDDITVISGLDDSLSGYDSDTTFESDRESDDEGSGVISHVDIKRMAMMN